MRLGEALIARAGSLAAGFALLWAVPASGATIEVETDADEFGAGGTSACTLREAVEAARTDKAFGGCPSGSGGDKILMPGSVTLGIDSGGGGTNASGDLDYDSKQKLTIIGSEDPNATLPAIHPEPGWDQRALEVKKGKVTLRGIDISGYESSEEAGGAVRVAKKGVLKLAGTHMEGNEASLRGGAVACEGCKSLNLSGPFGFDSNATTGADDPQGGAIWTNAPLVAKGATGFSGFPWTQSRFTGNQTATLSPFDADGGAIYATDDVTISKTHFLQNRVIGRGSGGALSIVGEPGKPTIKLTDSTFDANSALGRGGAVNLEGAETKLKVTRVAMQGNDASGLGGAIFTTQADSTIKDSLFDSNAAAALSGSSSAQGGGIYSNSGNAAEPNTLKIVSSSVTNNEVTGGDTQQGGGIFARGMDLRLLNSTIGSNQALIAGADGGGVYVAESVTMGQPTLGSARIEFTTLSDNVAGPGTTDGDAVYASVAENEISIRASIIDHGADGCTVSPGTDIQSGGYNLEVTVDADCGIDAGTDSHEQVFLLSLSENGSPPVGAPSTGLATLPIALSFSFASASSAAADIVPPGKCKSGGEKLKKDARGAPRPFAEGCDAGALEFTTCFEVSVHGENSFVGRNSADEIQGEYGETDRVLAQGGNDAISVYSDDDVVCAGSGDDTILPEDGSDAIDGDAGTDLVSYNNASAPLFVNLGSGAATEPSGTDELFSIEDLQGTEGDDEIIGSDKDNLLIGGGGEDSIEGAGGEDTIDAKDGEADEVIDCGPGDNSKEKAKIDEGLDPAPVSC
jgi:predicted outer membrane repeat protein